MERTKIIKHFFNGQWTVMDSSFLKSLTRTAHAHTVRVKKLQFYLYHLYVYGWVEDVSKITHAYRVRAVRMKFIFYPPPTPTLTAYLSL